MEYTVLARRFRPQSFGEVVGQENISQALRNAIAAGRVAHAYLFTGARGVGKTSTARILAKSLNCPNGSNGDPCNECEICRGVSTGSDIDVIEIDGASNRGIDEIRDLRANVNVKPMRTKYKIYIIDEVHMLTVQAFNALLKTLEEPPPNVKFIFCTTDPQKVPDTILSRCQRFDFGTIATSSIGQRLSEIATAEGVTVDPQAIQLVAKRAAGSMRDSQSLFDQLLAFGGKSIGPADVHRLLGTAPDDRILDLGKALLSGDLPGALALFDEAIHAGAQVSELTDQMIGYFRDLMVIGAGGKDVALMSVDDEQRATLAAQANSAGLQKSLAALQILAETKHRMKGAAFSRVLLELALIRIGTLENLDDLKELVVRLRQGGGAGNAAAAPSVSRVTNAGSAAGQTGIRQRSSDSLTAAVNRTESHRTAAEMANVERKKPENLGESPLSPADSESVEPVDAIPFEPGFETEIWAQVLSMLSDMTKTSAKNVSRTAISGPNALVLMFPKSYILSKQYLERSAEHTSRIEKTLERVVAKPIKVLFAEDELAVAPVRELTKPVEKPKLNEKPVDPTSDPFVQRALSVFGATVVRVEKSTSSAESSESKRE